MSDRAIQERELFTAIFEAVKSRGYFGREAQNSLAARQALKLQEEVAELVALFGLRAVGEQQPELGRVMDAIEAAGSAARGMFDDSGWVLETQLDPDQLVTELADIYVALACLVTLLEQRTGFPYALGELALQKARADASRGRR